MKHLKNYNHDINSRLEPSARVKKTNKYQSTLICEIQQESKKIDFNLKEPKKSKKRQPLNKQFITLKSQ